MSLVRRVRSLNTAQAVLLKNSAMARPQGLDGDYASKWTVPAGPSVCSFGFAHQKFSICQTFLGPPASAIANMRPFGDGNAFQISGLLDLTKTVALPSSETFNKALSRSKLCQDTRSRLPSADQLTPIKPFHPFTTRSCAWPVEVERSWILSWLEP